MVILRFPTHSGLVMKFMLSLLFCMCTIHAVDHVGSRCGPSLCRSIHVVHCQHFEGKKMCKYMRNGVRLEETNLYKSTKHAASFFVMPIFMIECLILLPSPS